MIFTILLVLFIVVPLAELALLLEAGKVLGLWGTLTLVVLTGVLGAALARMEGFKLLFDIRNDMSMGRMPTPRLVDGMLILSAGILLVTPGLLTDSAGFLLLIPPFRNYLKRVVGGVLRKKISKGVIEVDCEEW
jgi:UPF0716 protein FxsA